MHCASSVLALSAPVPSLSLTREGVAQREVSVLCCQCGLQLPLPHSSVLT